MSQLRDSKQICLHCDTTSIGLGTFLSTIDTHKNILRSASTNQAWLLQSAVIGSLPLMPTTHNHMEEVGQDETPSSWHISYHTLHVVGRGLEFGCMCALTYLHPHTQVNVCGHDHTSMCVNNQLANR